MCVTWVLEFLRAESVLHEFLIDAYCAMPDHLHFLAFGKSVTSDILKFSQSFKQKTTINSL
jgi:REP element-mobilizing transposase RayT